MKPFEYAAPRHEDEIVGLLSAELGETEILAGGTDLIGLLKKMVVSPRRVVNIKEVESLRGIQADSQGIIIGAVTTLDEILDDTAMDAYPAVKQAIRGINSVQLQAQGTLGGELCQRPRCWYFRDGKGLLADRGRLVVQGDSRYHAILGNSGPAKFVHASRLAPALIALGARVRILGPGAEDESILPLASFFRTPRDESQRENVLAPNQVLTHIHLPAANNQLNATYEIRHGEGPDYPLAAAAASLTLKGNIVSVASIVLGHVAPTPWVSHEAASVLIGRPISEESAAEAGEAAVAGASPLPDNGYKVQLAKVAAKRAILLAAGFESGGF